MEITQIETNPEYLPIQKGFIDYLVSFSAKVLSSLPEIDKSDHMAYMASLFTFSQHDRLKAVKLLVDAGLYMDAGQIARSMLEGMCYLIWADKEPSKRPLLFFNYAYVHDFKTMQRMEKWGIVYNPDVKKNIEDDVKSTKDTYYSSENRKKLKKGNPLSNDPYVSRWHENEQRSIWNVFKDIMAGQVYDIAYAETSEWLHWNIVALRRTFRRQGDTVKYSSAEPHTACIALSVGFQALHRSLQILDAHLKLGHEERLQELKSKFDLAFK